MKKFTTIICTLAMLASLTACSSNEAAGEEFTDNKQIVVNAPADSADKTPESESGDKTESVPDEKAPESTENTESKTESEPSGETDKPNDSGESNSEINTENKTEDKTEQTNTPAGAALPLKEYPDGSYFTYDGKPCTDHDNCDWDVECNCVNFDRSIQAMGFAKYVYFQVTGKHVSSDDKINVDADITAETAKSALMGVPAGTYIAVEQGNDRPHFMIAVDTDENGITVYQANYGGGCLVSTAYHSWADFAARFPHLSYYVK